jgi:predicted TIM-barrel fold metal-dependent hydrolase
MEEDEKAQPRLGAANLRRHPRYLFDELLADVTAGHDVRATVYVEAHAMYRPSGPEAFRSVGEIEFANGMGAIAASGLLGGVEICAGIVGGIDLSAGDVVEELLEAHMRAGGDRYRGVRAHGIAHDEDAVVMGHRQATPHLLRSDPFREGFGRLRAHGLSCDFSLLETQLPELAELAQAFPDIQIVVDHFGGVVGIGRYRREERFPVWRDNIRALAERPNVAMKLGGLGMPICGFASFRPEGGASSEVLAEEWRPYVETCIEAFGVDRCMFESNYPVDGATAGYPVLWNAFKRIAGGCSPDEKRALFSGTATRIYRLEI